MFDIFYIGKKPNQFVHELEVSSIEQAQQLSKTRYFWIIHYLADYTGFDFLWEPVPWESHQRHVWPSQWQKDGGTQLIPKNGYSDTNYHTDIIFRYTNKSIVLIDHGNTNTVTCVYNSKTRYVNSYLDTLKRIVSQCQDDYIWVTSSICDYTNFDFSWHPEPWQDHMIHVFASNEQQLGDTFYINVRHAQEKLNTVEMLEWYAINFVSGIDVPRPIPQVVHNADTHVAPIKSHVFDGPLAVFTDMIYANDVPTVSLWTSATKTVVALSQGARTIIVPREAQLHIENQVYDYPYIKKIDISRRDTRLPIVFVDNGESCADANWEHLQQVIGNSKIARVHGVKGRRESQMAAAHAAKYQWYWFVPAKLRIDPKFDWHWQPDRLQQPKHYIFYANNPVTGLCYGHMAAICYCRSLVATTQGNELDFTMESQHSVIPVVSGTATYDADPKMAWRTAFREVVKLKHQLSQHPDIETSYRLEQWLETGNGELGIYSKLGAQAAVDYYQAVNGRYDDLMNTYEWRWLDQLWEETSPHFNLKNV